MRRLTTLLMLVVVLGSMAACQKDESTQVNSATPVETVAETQTVAPTASPSDIEAEHDQLAHEQEALPPEEPVAESQPAVETPADSAPVAQAEPTYQEGVHYQVLPLPVRTSDPKRIEVAELFWYGCSHCYHFEPVVSKWAGQLPDDVVFAPSPAIWDPNMEPHARAFYTAKALKALDKVHVPIFEAINVRKQALVKEKDIEDLFAAQGVDRDKFAKTFTSFGVDNAVKQAEARQRGYRAEGTPELVVNGKYRISAQMAGGFDGMLKVASFLIEKERQSKAK